MKSITTREYYRDDGFIYKDNIRTNKWYQSVGGENNRLWVGRFKDLPTHIKKAEFLMYRLNQHRNQYYIKNIEPLIKQIYDMGGIVYGWVNKNDQSLRKISVSVERHNYSSFAVSTTGICNNEIIKFHKDGRAIPIKFRKHLENDHPLPIKILKKYTPSYEIANEYLRHYYHEYSIMKRRQVAKNVFKELINRYLDSIPNKDKRYHQILKLDINGRSYYFKGKYTYDYDLFVWNTLTEYDYVTETNVTI